MFKKFENLLVSSPNGGGVFLIHQGKSYRLDNINTTGIFCYPQGVVRGLQPDEFCVYEDSVRYIKSDVISFGDVHDVHCDSGFIYLVGTSGNEIIKFTKDGDEVQRWIFPGEKDSWHINCLATWNGRIVFSAFGDFRGHRGYKGNTEKAGFVQDLLTGDRLITGLSQPHSLVSNGKNLLLANSEKMEIAEFSPSGNLIRSRVFDGYTRGICIGENAIYVGLSCSRNIEFDGIDNAAIVSLDPDTLEEFDRINLPTKEIYAIQHFTDSDYLIRVISTIAASSSVRLTDSLSERDNQVSRLHTEVTLKSNDVADLHQAVAERDAQIGSLNQAVAERDGEIGSLNQAVAERDGQIGSLNQAVAERDELINFQGQRIHALLQTTSWRWTKPLRFVSSYVRFGIQALRGVWNRSVVRLPVFRQVALAYSLCLALPRAVSFYQGSLLLAMRRVWGVLSLEGIGGVVSRANILVQGKVSKVNLLPSAGLYGDMPSLTPGFMPKVSIIVPNFNHAKYLPERLESIYGQTYSNIEVILLDDCSNDDSVAILNDYAKRYPLKTICRFNDVNSGQIFNQWKQGLELATGELVWIAESDDYCSENLLEELVRYFQNQAVMLAFARTKFVRGTQPVEFWTSEEYLSDLNIDSWEQPFVKSAHMLVKSGWVVKNLIPNASGALFRNPGKINLLTHPEWLNLRMCGDWVFYLSIIRGGLVAYSPNATNYYRQHPLNTSVNAQKEELYYREHQVVAKYLAVLYQLERADLEKQEKHLYRHWCDRYGESKLSDFKKLYDLENVWPLRDRRKPNLVMAVYALAAGGGETFPIMLANLLSEHGYAVTLLNCNQQNTEQGVRDMLLKSIPLLELKNLEPVHAVFCDLGIEVVHSHHAWVDVSLATMLINSEIKQVISMHGMYEMMTASQLNGLMPLLNSRIDRVVYTAEKNLSPFSTKFQKEKSFVRIDNALPVTDFHPVNRADLGIAEEDFVICLVSRAIPEKGWAEAIEAVKLAQQSSARQIHLLLIGDGPEYSRLSLQYFPDKNIHFLGFKKNIRDYFSASDLGLLPSRFKGESFPLVLIDCLHSGTPVLASSVGEIPKMLAADGGLAGQVFDLDNWQIPINKVARIITEYALADSAPYQEAKKRTSNAAEKFNPEQLFVAYDNVYQSVLTG